MKTLIVTSIVSASLIFNGHVFAANASPGSTTVGSTLREYTNERSEENMEKRLKSRPVRRPATDARELLALPDGKNAIYVIRIMIQSDASINDKMEADITRTIAEYEGKDLSSAQMKKIASLITEQYGANTLRAYIPEQSFDGNILYINLVTS
jgi:hemolysin activation/secretion protein